MGRLSICVQIVISAIVLVIGMTAVASAQGRTGEIRDMKLPTPLFDAEGNPTNTYLRRTHITVPMRQIRVLGTWGSEKLVTIEIGGRNYIVHYDALVMINQARWDRYMRSRGEIVCFGQRRKSRRRDERTWATKGFC